MSSDRHRVLWLLLAATMLATAIGYQVMTAPEIDAGPKPPCMHEGKKSSQGAMLRLPSGWVRCDRGRWVPSS